MNLLKNISKKKNINKNILTRFELINFIYDNYSNNNVVIYRYIKFIELFIKIYYFNYLNFLFFKNSNIYLFDLLVLYKGSRHLRGLPVHGQRTWTNAWNAYKTNTNLRMIKLIICKRMYNLQNTVNYPIIYLAEHINNVWRLQWNKEWRLARKKRLYFLKNTYGLYKVDLYSLSSRNFVNINKLKKKTKKLTGKGTFSLGFDVNFTKSLFKLLSLQNNTKLKIQIIWNSNKK